VTVGQQISLRLPEDLLAELDRQARRRRRSRSDLIREILEQHVRLSATPDHPYSRVKDLVGLLSGGPPDLGRDHRAYLVGLVRDRRR
jgi:Arc/MetJ-type ribon-helix-helix transcriptional regulator